MEEREKRDRERDTREGERERDWDKNMTVGGGVRYLILFQYLIFKYIMPSIVYVLASQID